jgi:enoyl-CoA hydratase/carnithine racemase
MEFETIKIVGDGAVRHLVLNRPQVHNAVNRQFLLDVTQACTMLDRIAEVRVVIVRGEGKSFCSGADLKEAGDVRQVSDSIDRSKLGARMADLLTNLTPITIACMHGYCIGGGAVIPAACDFRLAGTSTSLTVNEVSIGFNLTWHTIPAVVQLVGPARAKEMIILGHTYRAEELLQLGYVNEVHDDAALVSRAEELADEICRQPPIPAWATKASINAYAKALDRSVQHMDHLAAAFMLKSDNSRIARETYFSKDAPDYSVE